MFVLAGFSLPRQTDNRVLGGGKLYVCDVTITEWNILDIIYLNAHLLEKQEFQKT